MPEIITGENDAKLLEYYVERLSTLQASVQNLNQEMSRLRQDAKVNSVNLDALNFLSTMRTRHPNDYGGSVVDALIQYADSTGVDFERNPIRMEEESQRDVEVAEPTAAERYRSEYVVEDEEAESNFLVQLSVGLGITVLMLWLLV